MMIRLLRRKPGEVDFELVTFKTNDIPPYAILSHTWNEDEEVTYEELVAGRGKTKAGYAKIRSCGARADEDRIQYLWVDTCCIDKSSSAELSESLNSMYSWYQKAQVCYAYLDDWKSDSDWVDLVSLEQAEESIDGAEDEDYESQKQDSDEGDQISSKGYSDIEEEFETKPWRLHEHSLPQADTIAQKETSSSEVGSEPRLQSFVSDIDQTPKAQSLKWFTRGWTLQELIAPYEVKFYNRHWDFKGAKSDLVVVEQLSRITGIPSDVLGKKDERALRRTCLGQRMSWAASRQTSREEDIAYCLLGIFDVHMPMLYGEGRNAFLRLQEEILKHSTDLSIFGWTDTSQDHFKQEYRGLLSRHPREFHRLKKCQLLSSQFENTNEIAMTNKGVRFNTSLFLPAFEGTLADNVGVSFMDLNCLIDGKPRGILLQRFSGVYARVLPGSWIKMSNLMRRSEPRTLYITRDVDRVMEYEYNTDLVAGVKVQLKAHLDSYFLEIVDAWPSKIFDEVKSTFLYSGISSTTGFVKVAITEKILPPKKRRRIVDFILVIVYSLEGFRTFLLDGEHATQFETFAKSTWAMDHTTAELELRRYRFATLKYSTSEITVSDSSTDAHFRVTIKRRVKEQVTDRAIIYRKAVRVDLYDELVGSHEIHIGGTHA